MVRQNLKVLDTPLDKIGFTAKVSSPRTSLNNHRSCCRKAHCRLVVDEVGVDGTGLRLLARRLANAGLEFGYFVSFRS